MCIALLYASYTDCKRREIPIWLFPSFFAAFLIVNYNTVSTGKALIGFFIALAAYTMLAMFFNGGGGDILMMCVIGAVYGAKILMHIAIAASLLCLIYYAKKKENTAPYAPFVLCAYILCFIGGYLYGSNDYRFLGYRYFFL